MTSHLVRLKGDNTSHSPYKRPQVIVANIDLAVIIATAAEPRFTPNLIDRYLLLCQYGHIRPLIVLNKCDLTAIRHPVLAWYQDRAGIPVVEVSVKDHTGIEGIRNNVVGKSVVLIGPSGVGKTSIINQLLGKMLKTQPVCVKNKRGRHTTTTTTLYPLEGGYIIDTPGVRSLDIGNISRHELKDYFPAFQSLSDHCRYKNCLHLHEPGCAIKKAQGDNDRVRYQTYLRMLESLR